MIIDKKTGDIIFGEDQVLKAKMTVEELKASKLMEFVTEKGLRYLEEGHSTILRVPNAHGHTIYMDLQIYEGIISEIYITLEEYYDFYRNSYMIEDYEKLVEMQREFLEKALQVYSVPNEIRYEWGKIELCANYRDMESLDIFISYYRERRSL